MKKKVIIYGYGRIGKKVSASFDRNLYDVEIWDRSAELLPEFHDAGVRFPDFEKGDRTADVIICLFSKNASADVRREFEMAGFQHIRHCSEIRLCGASNFEPIRCNKCLVEEDGCEAYREYLLQGYERTVNIDVVSLITNYSCSLRCKNCVEHVFEILPENRLVADVKTYTGYIAKLVQAFGFITQVTIGGGEALLYPHWADVVRFCVNEPKIGVVNLLTNGVAKVSDDQLSVLKNIKVVVTLDHYGRKMLPVHQRMYDELRAALIRQEISYTEINNENGSWYDFGGFHDRGYTKEKLEEVYRACVYGNCVALNPDGTFAICNRQAYAHMLFPEEPYDMDGVIDLNQEDDATVLAEKIQSLLQKKSLNICNRCNGIGITVPSGIQVET